MLVQVIALAYCALLLSPLGVAAFYFVEHMRGRFMDASGVRVETRRERIARRLHQPL